MSDHLITVNKNTYDALQREVLELRQLAANLQQTQCSTTFTSGLFIEYIPVAIAMFDRDMRYLLASKRWREDYNLVDQDIIGRFHVDVCPDIILGWQRIFQSCLAGNTEKYAEDTLIRRDGTIDWVKWEISPWYEESGEMGGLTVFSEVITARKQSEIALVDSERRLKDIATNMPGAIFQFTNRNNEWRVDYISDFIWQLAGITATEMMADLSCFFARVHPEDIESHIATVVEAVENSTPWHYEGRLIKPSGEIRWWQGDSTPTRTETGEIIFCGVLLDITERKHTEAELKKFNEELEARVEERTLALQQTQARLQRLADNVPGMLYEFSLKPDGARSFPFVSSGCLELTRRHPKQLQDDASLSFTDIHPEDIIGVEEAIAHSAQKLQNFEYDWRIITILGEHKWLKAMSRPERLEDGEIIWYGYLQDVTEQQIALRERQQAEIQLQQQADNLEKTLRELQLTQTQLIQSEKMSSIGNMVAGVAHEINNPVNFIHGNLIPAGEYAADLLNLVELYQIHCPYPSTEIQELIIDIDFDFIKEDLVKLLKSMRVGTERIREIVLSLRNFSRLDEAEFKRVDIHQGIDSTLMILQNRLKPKSEHPEILVVKQYGDLPLIECYPGQLNQVFMNLLSNAIDALDESVAAPIISIRTELVNSDLVRIMVADNGSGIPPAIMAKLFDPFFTTKSVGKGTGLGLSISYQIVVDRHQGKLYCNSTPGEGAEFVIEIPIHH